ncbi:phage tail repeat-like family [Trichomonas vaginalis G3]|uniref:phage tail repeat-like family n=1 Tax=Trichomonas vaginalis (strain ATCC PRA-98 / G3) TaxID=412133 RepID=UPI0021E55482|nr:phage tail repeat-like family [Trichomonas vaginalis G3]KAI5527238.1 phage tail repeat-like family [Trichomonas vaginalis G3]
MSKDIASMREIQHNRQLIMQALNKNTTNFSNYSKISESLKEGNLKLTINPMTDEFLFQDNKNHTVCINPTKGTLNEKPIDELLLKADIDNKADKEYVDDAIAKEEERANNAYATKEHTHPELADKTYVDNKMSSEVTRAENEYSKKTHTHSISEITDLNVSLEKKADKEYVASKLEKKADKEYVDEKDNEMKERVDWYHEWTSKTFKVKADTGWVSGCLDLKADKTYVNDELEKKADKNHTHTSFTTVAIESIEGTVEETGGDALYCKPPNFPQGLTSDDDITTMLNIRCKDVYVMKDEHNIKFTAQDLYDKKADKTELQTLKTEILQTLYPIGSIYTSMNSTRPEVVLGLGTWTQIVDRFLYCANSSKETGGSKTISGANLPAHSHYINLSTSEAGLHSHRFWDWSGMTKGKGYDVKEDVKFAINCYWSNTEVGGSHTHRVSGYTQTTGQSKDYMPPYMTVYAWYRNA